MIMAAATAASAGALRGWSSRGVRCGLLSRARVSFSSAANEHKIPGNLPSPPVFSSVAEERAYKKQRLAASCRIFGKFGYDEGAAGHITLRDPEFPHTFWVNPFGVDFSEVTVSNLIRVDEGGNVIEGKYPVNAAAFAIHSRIHQLRPDVNAAAHSHSPAGKTWSTLNRLLDPITQDVCAFYEDLALYSDYGGVAFEIDEGQRIAEALGSKKAAILKSHGLLTVGQTVDEATWFYVALERACQVQLQAEMIAAASGKKLEPISVESAKQASQILGSHFAGWFQYQALYRRIRRDTNDEFLQ